MAPREPARRLPRRIQPAYTRAARHRRGSQSALSSGPPRSSTSEPSGKATSWEEALRMIHRGGDDVATETKGGLPQGLPGAPRAGPPGVTVAAPFSAPSLIPFRLTIGRVTMFLVESDRICSD